MLCEGLAHLAVGQTLDSLKEKMPNLESIVKRSATITRIEGHAKSVTRAGFCGQSGDNERMSDKAIANKRHVFTVRIDLDVTNSLLFYVEMVEEMECSPTYCIFRVQVPIEPGDKGNCSAASDGSLHTRWPAPNDTK